MSTIARVRSSASRSSRKALGDARSRHNSLALGQEKAVPKIVQKIEPSLPPANRLGCLEDPQDAYEFDLEVYTFLKEHECDRLPSPDYTLVQKQIRPRMRTAVVDWLIDVHKKLRLRTDTLFTAVELMDLYLSVKSLDKNKFQLLASASLLIAAKSEETTSPSIDDFVFIAKDTFTIEQMIEMERDLLGILKFQVNPIHSSHFLKRYLRFMDNTTYFLMLAHFINESLLLDDSIIGVKPSLRAAAVIYLCLSLDDRIDEWDSDKIRDTGYTAAELVPVVKQILIIMNKLQISKYKTIRKKYSTDYLCRVGLTVFPLDLKIE